MCGYFKKYSDSHILREFKSEGMFGLQVYLKNKVFKNKGDLFVKVFD